MWEVSVEQNNLTDHSGYLILDTKLTKTRMMAMWAVSVERNNLTDHTGYLNQIKVNQNKNDRNVRSISSEEQEHMLSNVKVSRIKQGLHIDWWLLLARLYVPTQTSTESNSAQTQ